MTSNERKNSEEKKKKKYPVPNKSKRKYRLYSPVHITSMSGNNFAPMVLRYSEEATAGTARAAQYSEKKKKKKYFIT